MYGSMKRGRIAIWENEKRREKEEIHVGVCKWIRRKVVNNVQFT